MTNIYTPGTRVRFKANGDSCQEFWGREGIVINKKTSSFGHTVWVRLDQPLSWRVHEFWTSKAETALEIVSDFSKTYEID